MAARRNHVCGVGIAYDSKAAGVRILGGRITTSDEASALNYGYDKVGIYSCSWGPRDNGQTMSAPNYLVRKAFSEGINNGREGKGSIFVFASGNGGKHEDQCNFDGYTNSIYSVTVGAVDHMGLHPTYSEACAANMIVAYSSGSGKHIVRIICRRMGFLFAILITLVDYYRSRKGTMRLYAWRNLCRCTQCRRCFCARIGSTVSLFLDCFVGAFQHICKLDQT